MGSSHSSGSSSYELEAKQEAAEKAEKEKLKAEREEAIAAANRSVSGGNEGGQGSGGGAYENGVLSKVGKKKSTLAGEGEQTFGEGKSLGG